MAMSGGAHSGAFGKRRHRRNPVMSEINVTPMVDVMLVLLIIFMVSAPLLTVGVPIDLPQTQAVEPRPGRQGAAGHFGQHQGPGFPAEHRDQDRRTGAQAEGDCRRRAAATTSASMFAAIGPWIMVR